MYFNLYQDYFICFSKGEIYDWTQENLGRIDTPINLMLQQFGDQLRIVKDSGEPMNVLLDEESMAELIHGGAWVHEKEVRGGAHPVHTSFRFNYHRGYNHGDSDRYGPAVHRIMDLMCRLEGLDTADWK